MTTPLTIQLTANVPGKATEDDPSAWSTTIHMRDLHGVPGSWLKHDTAMASAAIWEVDQQIEFSLFNSPFPRNKQIP